jgi:hypothetical protein
VYQHHKMVDATTLASCITYMWRFNRDSKCAHIAFIDRVEDLRYTHTVYESTRSQIEHVPFMKRLPGDECDYIINANELICIENKIDTNWELGEPPTHHYRLTFKNGSSVDVMDFDGRFVSQFGLPIHVVEEPIIQVNGQVTFPPLMIHVALPIMSV